MSKNKLEFCQINIIDVQKEYRSRPILDVEILGTKGIGLIDTAAKLNVVGHSLYKILIEKGQKFSSTKLRIGLANDKSYDENVLTNVDVH